MKTTWQNVQNAFFSFFSFLLLLPQLRKSSPWVCDSKLSQARKNREASTKSAWLTCYSASHGLIFGASWTWFTNGAGLKHSKLRLETISDRMHSGGGALRSSFVEQKLLERYRSSGPLSWCDFKKVSLAFRTFLKSHYDSPSKHEVTIFLCWLIPSVGFIP